MGVHVFKNTKDPTAALRLDIRDKFKYVLFNLKIGGSGYTGSIGHAYATPEEALAGFCKCADLFTPEEALAGFCKCADLFNKDISFHARVPDETIITSWELAKEEN